LYAPAAYATTEKEWLVHVSEVRGLAPATVVNYSRAAGKFFTFLANAGVAGLGDATAEHLRAFHDTTLAETTNTRGQIYKALRSLFRFGAFKGWMSPEASELVGRTPTYKLSHLPDFLSRDEVLRVLKTPDMNTPLGTRNYAVLALLATYGIRSGDLAALRLEDFDWEHDVVRVRQSKVGRTSWLPLLPGVGNSVLRYLRLARPATSDRRVFVSIRYPYGGISSGAIYDVVNAALRKAGISKTHLGPHLFRHTAATRLVQNDEPINTVADVLGHARRTSVGVYAKVAIEQLREVALSIEETCP